MTKEQKERVRDSRLKIQSARETLRHVNPKEIPEFEQLEECLEDVERNLGSALRNAR